MLCMSDALCFLGVRVPVSSTRRLTCSIEDLRFDATALDVGRGMERVDGLFERVPMRDERLEVDEPFGHETCVEESAQSQPDIV